LTVLKQVKQPKYQRSIFQAKLLQPYIQTCLPLQIKGQGLIQNSSSETKKDLSGCKLRKQVGPFRIHPPQNRCRKRSMEELFIKWFENLATGGLTARLC